MKVLALKVKRTLLVSPFCLAILLSPLKSHALTIQEVPNPRQINGGWVTDMADILDQTTETQLNSLISQLETKNGTEIAVVTVPETAPSALPKEFTTALFNYWGIGKKDQDNGVLFLISKRDRRVEIETGYGIEAILPDAQVGNIIDTQIIGRFKQADFNGGTLAGTKALIVSLEADRVSSVSNKPTTIAPETPEKTLIAQPSGVGSESTQDVGIPWGMLAGGGGLSLVIGVVAFRSRRLFVKPEGYSRISDTNRPIHCADCKKRMEKVEEMVIQPTLSQPEKVAQQLGSVRFEGWKCLNCSQHLTGQSFHLIAYVLSSNRFIKCPHCHELTATRTTKILKQATRFSSGKRLITKQCHCCSYRKEEEETIPCLPPPSSSSPGGGGYSGGCSTGGSTGGSFGGGSSGGGGAGGSF